MSENKPQPTHGDLVSVNGYGNRVFQVESYYDQRWYYVDEQWTDRIYELFDCGNADWLEADAKDLTLLADASQADEYLRANPAPMEPSSIDFSGYLFGMDIANQFIGGGNEMKQPEKKPTARELSGQEAERRKQARKDRKQKIDACLDWMNYYREQGGADAEAKVAEIKQELAELVSEGDGR
jgi:hypothetical protein